MRLPPGRAKLATRPSPTGSVPAMKTIGIVEVRYRRERGEPPLATIRSTLRLDQVGGQSGQPIIGTFGPAEFDRHVLALDEAGVAQSLVNWPHGPGRPQVRGRRERLRSEPITGSGFCCARRVRAVVMAAPTRSSNSRRLIRSIVSGREQRGGAMRARLEAARTMGNPA